MRRRGFAVASALGATVLAAVVAPVGNASSSLSFYQLPSGSAHNEQGSTVQQLSDNGRLLLYTAGVPAGPHAVQQVELANLKTHHVQLISASPKNVPGNGPSWGAAMTPDARYVAFYSNATNLVKSPPNIRMGVFLYDRKLHRMNLINVGADHREAPGVSVIAGERLAVSADGSKVAFFDVVNSVPSLFVAGVGSPMRPVAVDSQGRPLAQYSGYIEVSGGPMMNASGTRIALATASKFAPDDPPTMHVVVFDFKARKSYSFHAPSSTDVVSEPVLDSAGDEVVYASCPRSATNMAVDAMNGLNYEFESCWRRPEELVGLDTPAGGVANKEVATGGDVLLANVKTHRVESVRAHDSDLLAATAPTISGDGSTVYFLGADRNDLINGQWSLWRWSLQSNAVTRLTGLDCVADTAPTVPCAPKGPGTHDENYTHPSTNLHGTVALFRTAASLESSDTNDDTTIYMATP